MQYGLDVSSTGAYADAERMADLAALAEGGGWDGFFVQDGLLTAEALPLVDPWVALCVIAVRGDSPAWWNSGVNPLCASSRDGQTERRSSSAVCHRDV
jgi:hypothetical protein